MAERKDTDPPEDRKLSDTLRMRVEQVIYQILQWFSFIRVKTEDTRHQLKEVFYNTSDQMLEKAEETRKSVKMRMAILEIEHHLNRLYPQIGKLACDLAAKGAKGAKSIPKDEQLKLKIDLAEEYRQRLDELKSELTAHQQRGREPDK